MTRTIGWAREEQDGWRYRCADHSPEIYAGWQMIRAGDMAIHGPFGLSIAEHPPLCEVCGADLRPKAVDFKRDA